MGLPMDFSTALWWRSVPLWEWEALPPALEATASSVADSTGGDAWARCSVAGSPTAAGSPDAPPARPGAEREGFQRVFKGYQVSASLFWYPADSPLSRPWLRDDGPALDRHRGTGSDDDAAARARRQAAADTGAEGP